MNKRYQVFISSTFEDLKEERQSVLKAILELDHIPVGMEFFPASDDDPWKLIRGIIKDSDYYVLIIGGQYGSLDEDGIGYTEKEYDFALSKGKPIIPLLHQNPDKILCDKPDTSEATWIQLQKFRKKVEDNHTCKYWNTPDDLKVKVTQGFISAIKKYPAPGWVRNNPPYPDFGELEKNCKVWKPKLSKLFCDSVDIIGITYEDVDIYNRGNYRIDDQNESEFERFKKENEFQIKDRHAIITHRVFSEHGRSHVEVEAIDFYGKEFLRLHNAKHNLPLPGVLSANVIVFCCEEKNLLLHYRSHKSVTESGKLHTFGGAYMPPGDFSRGVDDRKSLRITAMRETFEESSLLLDLINNRPPMLLLVSRQR